MDRMAGGLLFAVLSALAFGASGALARPMLETGWSPGAVVLVRVLIGGLVLLPLGLAALRGRWALLRAHAGSVVIYGLVAVAGCQLAYFSAVQHMQVGPALLIEYTAPAAIVLWHWVRHGQRPGRLTLLGAAVAGVGLVLVLDLLSGADLAPVGVAWALLAMLCVAIYFIMSADERNALPPMTLAAGGLLVATAVLALAGLVGVLPMRSDDAAVTYAGHALAWWVPLLLLGVVTAAISYATGIAAGRRLGARLASFVALSELIFAVLFAWVLLDELPRAVQLAGGVLILVGVVTVKLGEPVSVHPDAAPISPE